MSKQAKYVAFSTQKGGAGKTALTVLTSSWLHYVKGYNVAVIPYYLICGKILYAESEIYQFLEKGRRRSIEE